MNASRTPDVRASVRLPEEISRERRRQVLGWLGWVFVTAVGLYVLWYVAVLIYWNFTGTSPGL